MVDQLFRARAAAPDLRLPNDHPAATPGGYDLAQIREPHDLECLSTSGPPEDTLSHYPDLYNHQKLSITGPPACLLPTFASPPALRSASERTASQRRQRPLRYIGFLRGKFKRAEWNDAFSSHS